MEPEDDNTRTHVVLSKGTMVSHYRIVEKIGAGGMGEVYLALDTKLNRKVALKFLPSHLCQDDDCRARFKREAQAVAKLSHPNVVTIYEVSEHHGRPFFAMEHVEGKSLRNLLKDRELELDLILDLAMQVCEGLSKAHQSGITHRDVKPSNIVIDADGRPKLLDFGLAAIQGVDKVTKTGSTLGTIGYMSPEQIQAKEVDQRSDLFSLGVVLYEMTTGRLPFT
ncbi:MAG: serine/threonine protein kinase, partial [candidate division Zixibacteria bacterium]|nr:serine/threonine protein kinase [candidate division Zixibacteria bacterium]